jgi:predicted nucleotidyltransferase
VSAVPRGVVEMDRWVEIAKRRRREIAAAFIKEACRVGDVVLFGSRARGDFHDMSDWDLAVVTKDGEYAVKTEEFGHVVYIPLAKLRQLLDFSMLILDVAYEGRLLCGRGEFWQEFTREVMQYIRERRLGKISGVGIPSRPPTQRRRLVTRLCVVSTRL